MALVGAYPSDHNRIYINNGTSFVRNSNWLESLPLVGHGGGGAALIFGDYDNDGDLDLVFAGSRSTDFYTGVYINNGTSLVDNSSWKGDLKLEFDEIVQLIKSMKFQPTTGDMGSESSTIIHSIKKVKDSDMLILVLGNFFSEIVQKEYYEALENYIPVLVFIKKNSGREKELTKFIQNIK